MYFEAESNGIKYEITVTESKSEWKIGLRSKDGLHGKEGQWIYYDIHKDDYQHMDGLISFIFKNSSYLVDVVRHGTTSDVYCRGSYRTIKLFNEETILHESLKAGGSFGGDEDLIAGMPGKIVKVMVKEGQEIGADEPLLIMEAMKMENEMRSPKEVKIAKVHVKAGDSVDSGATLISFEK